MLLISLSFKPNGLAEQHKGLLSLQQPRDASFRCLPTAAAAAVIAAPCCCVLLLLLLLRLAAAVALASVSFTQKETRRKQKQQQEAVSLQLTPGYRRHKRRDKGSRDNNAEDL